MIEINLLPGARTKKAARRSTVSFGSFASGLSGRLTDKFMIAAVVGVVVSVGAVALLYLSQQQRDARLQARIEKAVADSTRYANFLKDRYHAEAVRDTLLRQVNIIPSAAHRRGRRTSSRFRSLPPRTPRKTRTNRRPASIRRFRSTRYRFVSSAARSTFRRSRAS